MLKHHTKNVTKTLLPYQPSIHITDMVNMLISCEARLSFVK